MALKNLFDMVKADRYTADGREAIIKAQEAETEDATRRTYQIGEISQATGLQKTANGWVKPKNGKQPKAKKDDGSIAAAERNMDVNEHVKYLEQDLKQAQKTKAGPDKEFNIKYKILETLAGGTDSAYESFKEALKTTNNREQALEQALNKYNYSQKKTEKQPGAKKEEYKPSRRVDPKKQPQVSNPNVLGMTANGAKKRFEALGGEFLENKDGVDIFKTKDGDLVEVHYGDNKKVLRTQTTPADSVNLTTVRQGPKTKTLNETPAQHVQKNLDAYTGYSPYDMEELVLKPSGYEKSRSTKGPDGVSSITYKKDGGDDILLFFDKYGELKNAGTSQNREGVMQKMRAAEGYGHMKVVGDYDVYRVTSGPDKGKYKVSKVGSLREVTMSEEKAADFLTSAAGKNKTANKDSAPSLSEIVDRVYNIGEISEKTGLQKTAQGWKPPKETKFGKVKQNKEGQWGVQTKQGKGSDFLKHKSEKEASRALANYTAGYNTTERSKQDPHSDQARQVKHWDKEVEKIKKENRAEGRAAHAAQFQKPAAESKPQPVSPTAQVEIAEMAMTQAAGLSPAGLAKKYNISEADAKAVRKIMDDMNENARKDRATGEYPGKYSHTKNKPAAEGWEEIRMASGKIYDLKSQGKRIIEQYDPETETKTFKLRDLNNSRAPDKEFKSLEEAKNAATKSAEDAAPRVLTGDCRIRIRKEKPALTGDTKIRVRK